jgi:hypothetical protein
MGTLVKDARGRSKFWYYCYRDASGRRLKKSTKETDRRKARIIGEGFEDAEDLAKRGNATEEQIRKVISETLARVTGSESMIRRFANGLISGWQMRRARFLTRP